MKNKKKGLSKGKNKKIIPFEVGTILGIVPIQIHEE